MQKNCVDCTAPYEITESEVDFYKGKGFPLPKRCFSCRTKRREKNQGNKPFKDKLNNL